MFLGGSIKRKLISITMMTSTAALLCACLALAVFEIRGYRGTLKREMESIAQIVSASSQAAMTFHDYKAAQETLLFLRAEPSIITACIYGPDGKLVAHYQKSGLACPQRNPGHSGAVFESDYLRLTRDIELEDQRLGTVHLVSELKELYTNLARFALVTSAVLLGSVLFAFIISSVLQKVISVPLLSLAQTANRVTEERDYEVRAVKHANNEIGVLVDQFNEMLAQIHSRDMALQQAQDELEAKVEARTAELQAEIAGHHATQTQLLKAKEIAEEANQAKSAFLANMSHELRTPLNAVIGYSEMLQEEAQDRGEKWPIGDLGKIGAAGRHLLSLINDVLDISKIEAGRMTVHIEPAEIRQLIHEAVSTTQPLARKNANELVVECDTRYSMVNVDVIKFRQSLLNLLSNACKFTENGKVTLRVTDAGQDGFVNWQVSDTGIGIDAAQAEKLFKPFSQVDSTSTRKHGGTGLGLAITQRLCDMMGGRITFASQPGHGSTFCIYIPAGQPGPNQDKETHDDADSAG